MKQNWIESVFFVSKMKKKKWNQLYVNKHKLNANQRSDSVPSVTNNSIFCQFLFMLFCCVCQCTMTRTMNVWIFDQSPLAETIFIKIDYNNENINLKEIHFRFSWELKVRKRCRCGYKFWLNVIKCRSLKEIVRITIETTVNCSFLFVLRCSWVKHHKAILYHDRNETSLIKISKSLKSVIWQAKLQIELIAFLPLVEYEVEVPCVETSFL